MSSWWQKDGDESKNTWSKDKWDANNSWWQSSDWNSSAASTPSLPTPPLPTSFVSDHQHHDKTPLGKGAHVLYKQVQPTEWSCKSGLAGRDVTDIRAYELSHRGLGDCSFRLFSEGRHQSIVWARSGSESVLLTALLEKIRESGISIDEAAKVCHKEAPPGKHKEAMRFMEPLAQDLVDCIAAKVPVQNSDASEQLAKAKAKLAEHGIEISPLKRKSDSAPNASEQHGKRAKLLCLLQMQSRSPLPMRTNCWINPRGSSPGSRAQALCSFLQCRPFPTGLAPALGSC